jgi:uncharacterized membrane protein YkvI
VSEAIKKISCSVAVVGAGSVLMEQSKLSHWISAALILAVAIAAHWRGMLDCE